MNYCTQCGNAISTQRTNVQDQNVHTSRTEVIVKAGRFGPDACAPPGVFGPTLKSLPRWSRDAVEMWPKRPKSAEVPQTAQSSTENIVEESLSSNCQRAYTSRTEVTVKTGSFFPDTCTPLADFSRSRKSPRRWSREAVARWPKTPQSAKIRQPPQSSTENNIAGNLLQKPRSGGGRGIYRGLVEGDMPTTILITNVGKLQSGPIEK